MRLSSAIASFDATRSHASENRQNLSQDVSVCVSDPACKYFQVLDYFQSILGNIYKQMQYPADFNYDPNDEDDAEVMEVSLYILCFLFFLFATATASGTSIASYAPCHCW